MAYFRIDMMSKSLEMATSLIVVIPDEIAVKNAPVVYLLHGLSDNCTGWSRNTSAERYARDHKVCLVMPEVQRSFYADMFHGLKYFSFIKDELPAWCAAMLNLKGPKYIMGLSMGGYGALKCYLNNMGHYHGCAAFSAVTDIASLRNRPLVRRQELAGIFDPEQPISDESDLFKLVEKQTKQGHFYISCGEQDSLYKMNKNFVEVLSEKKHEILCSFRPGAHTWDFWDESLRQALNYFFPLEDA